MPDKEQIIKLLNEYGVSDRYVDNLYDEIVECFVPELEKAEKMKEALKVVKVWFHFFARDVGTNREEAMVKAAAPVIQQLEDALSEVKDANS